MTREKNNDEYTAVKTVEEDGGTTFGNKYYANTAVTAETKK